MPDTAVVTKDFTCAKMLSGSCDSEPGWGLGAGIGKELRTLKLSLFPKPVLSQWRQQATDVGCAYVYGSLVTSQVFQVLLSM